MPVRRLRAAALAAALLVLGAQAARAAAAPPVRHDVATLRGLVVDRYTWHDTRGRPRSVALVRYGQPGGGGYALRMTYQVRAGGRWRTVRADAPAGAADGGFGYVVSHEAFRTFDAPVCAGGGTSCTIASLHNEDDSPLGRYLPGTGEVGPRTRDRATHVFHLLYPHWGTAAPLPDPTGGLTPSSAAAHRRYLLPVTVRWTFANGRDDPRWSVAIDLSGAAADTLSVDARGPYGVLAWDGGRGAALTRVEWGDARRFRTLGGPVTTASGWTWAAPNPGARYVLLAAGASAFGLVDVLPHGKSRLGSGYADARGRTSDDHPGCPDLGWTLPCDWQWTYQSVQYEGLASTPTALRKLAWGTAPYLGQSRTTDDDGAPFAGYPVVRYTVRVVLEASGGARIRGLADATR